MFGPKYYPDTRATNGHYGGHRIAGEQGEGESFQEMASLFCESESTYILYFETLHKLVSQHLLQFDGEEHHTWLPCTNNSSFVITGFSPCRQVPASTSPTGPKIRGASPPKTPPRPLVNFRETPDVEENRFLDAHWPSVSCDLSVLGLCRMRRSRVLVSRGRLEAGSEGEAWEQDRSFFWPVATTDACQEISVSLSVQSRRVC